MPLLQVPETHHSESDFSLAPDVIECLWQMEERHYWHRERNAWIVDALIAYGSPPPCTLLEVGCGSGAVTRALETAGYEVTGVDTAQELVKKAQQRCPKSTLAVCDVARLPEGHRGPFQVIGIFDVLEHLEEPVKLLRSALKWATPGALVIATVPALRSLHSVVDELSGHKCRFELGELTTLFESANIESVIEHGIFASTLPVQWLARVGRQPTEKITNDEARVRIMARALRVPAEPINLLLGWLVSIERMMGLERARGRKGASILAVGRTKRSIKAPAEPTLET